MIPAGFVQELLSRVDIVELVGRHVELKRGGANFMGLCPFHSERSPSFSVSPSKQFYHCFGCGASGDAIRFLTEHQGLSFVEAVRDLAQGAGLQVPEEQVSADEKQRRDKLRERRMGMGDLLNKAAEFYRSQLKQSPRAIDYLKRRGLTGAIAARFGLGFAPPGWRTLAGVFPRYDDPLLEEAGLVRLKADDGAPAAAAAPSATAEPNDRGRYDWFRDRVMFPIRAVSGEIIGFGGRVLDDSKPKYMNSPETPLFSKGRELYGLFEARSAIRERGNVLVVEGYMDVVALAQNGFANAVATLGTACTADHLTKLFRFTDSVVFSFDGDKAGRRAAARALEAALPHATDLRSVKFLFLPSEHDPDSYVRELGAQAFEDAMAAAVPLSQQLLEQAAEDADLDTAEGRARMLAQAKPLWMALPEGALRRQMLPELARRAALSVDDLHALWGAQNAAKRSSGGPSGGGNSSSPWSGPDDLPNEDFSAYDVGYEDTGAWSGDPGGASARPAASDRNGGWPTDGRSDGPRRGGGKWGGGGGGGDWKGKGKWNKTPAGPFDHLPRPPKKAPAAGADLVLRLLLRHSAWWEQLSSDDQHLLHGLGGAHGEALAWLERQLMEHGPQPWSALLEALAGEPFAAQAQAWVGDGSIEESHELADLQRVVHRLWVDHLVQSVNALIAEGRTDREQLDRIAALNAAIKQHREAQAALGQGKPLP